MSEEIFEPWLGDQNFVPDVADVHWTGDDGLRIGVASEDTGAVRVWIRFRLPRAVQSMDEGYRLRSIPIGRGLIWRVQSSEYLAAFRRSACGTMDSFPLTHWLIVSANQCVDVLSELEPEVGYTSGQ